MIIEKQKKQKKAKKAKLILAKGPKMTQYGPK